MALVLPGTVPLGRTAAVGKVQVRGTSPTSDSLEDGSRTEGDTRCGWRPREGHYPVLARRR